MDDLEMTRTLFLLLEEYERKMVIKQAIAKGFSIPGFSRKPYMAPLKTVQSVMAKKMKHGTYGYEMIMQVLAEQCNTVSDPSEVFLMAKDWLNDVCTHERIVSNVTKQVNGGDEEKEKIEHITEESKSSKELEESEQRVRELEQTLLELKDKNRKYKATIQESKIEIDNLKRKLSKQTKENQQQEHQLEQLKQTIKKYQIGEENLKNELKRYQQYTRDLQEQVHDLTYYKERAPKILCLAVCSQSFLCTGYNMILQTTWNEKVKEEIQQHTYGEIWIVHRGFPYSVIREMKECCQDRVKEYLTVEQLLSSIGGQEV